MPPTLEDAEILREANRNYENAIDHVRENRVDQMDDQRFRASDQWPEDIKNDRELENRPCLTFNMTGQFVRQITGDARINKPAIKVRAAGGGADKEGAEVREGLIREIEQRSFASSVYAAGLDNAAVCGEGHWQIVSRFVDDEMFDQDLWIERITNPFAVLWDPDSQQQTRADAGYCFVLDEMTEDKFKEKYPDALMADFRHESPYEGMKHWRNGNNIVIADYWVKEPQTQTIIEAQDGAVINVSRLVDSEGDPLSDEAIELMKAQAVRVREVESFQVAHYILSGVEVLEERQVWPSKYIPVFTVYGEEIHIGEKTMPRGIVRDLKDAQRLYNYMRSAAAEAIALQPKSPFIGTVKQFAGDVWRYWKNMNKKNYAVLPYNPDPDAPGAPQRSEPPPIQLAMAQESSLSKQDMHSTSGIYPPALGDTLPGNPSGQLQQSVVSEGDVGTFVYQDNLRIAMTQTGVALLDVMTRIYDGTRIIKILNEDDTDRDVPINQVVPVTDEEGNPTFNADGTPKTTIVADMTVGRYGVRVDIGPAFTTRRKEAGAAMLDFVRTNPENAMIIMDLVAKNQDWPGADQVADRFRKIAIARGFAEPEEDEEVREPDPQTVAEAQKTQAEAEEAKLKTAKIAAEIDKLESETNAQQLENINAAIATALQTGTVQQALQQAVLDVIAGITTNAADDLQPQQDQALLDVAPQNGVSQFNGGAV